MNAQPSIHPPALITPNNIGTVVPFGRTRALELEKQGLFPRRVRISERKTAWRLRDIQEWIEALDYIEGAPS